MIDTPPQKPRMSPLSRGLLFASPLLLAALVGGGGAWAMGWLDRSPAAPYGVGENRYLALYHSTPDTPPPAVEPDGGKLYQHYCAHCHGVNGDGNGPTPLSPKARHFGHERFKFTDTLNGLKQPQGAAGTLGGIPTDDVLVALVRRGIAGSPMPSFAHLPEAEVRAVVRYIRTRFLRPDKLLEGRLSTELAKARLNPDFDEAEDWPPKKDKQAKWLAEAVADLTTSEPCPVPSPFPPAPPGYEQRAGVLFEKLGCVGCHGKDGRGTFDPNRKNDNGTLAYPRDLTADVFKGGPEPEHLYRRIFLGIPGTPMKAFGREKLDGKELTADEIVDLVYYVKRFATPPAGVP